MSDALESQRIRALDTPNTTAFNTVTSVTTGDLPDLDIAADFLEVGGRSYLVIDRTANRRSGSKSSCIWGHRHELRLLADQNPQYTYYGSIKPADSHYISRR
jgi:hypothetical protein